MIQVGEYRDYINNWSEYRIFDESASIRINVPDSILVEANESALEVRALIWGRLRAAWEALTGTTLRDEDLPDAFGNRSRHNDRVLHSHSGFQLSSVADGNGSGEPQ